MKRLLLIAAALAVCSPAYAARPLKEDTAVVTVVGPLVDSAGAAVTAPTIASIDITAYKNDGTAVTITPAASGTSNDMVHVDDGYFSLELTTTDTSTPGYLRLTFQISGSLIFHEDYEILPANIYDSRFSTDKLEVDVVQNGGSNITSASGVQEVKVQSIAANAIAAAATAADFIAEINAEVLDVLNVDTFAEPTGVPPATATLTQKIGTIYMALRNGVSVTATEKTYLDDGGAGEFKKTTSDNGTTYSEGEAASP
jgi:hypothetical protein